MIVQPTINQRCGSAHEPFQCLFVLRVARLQVKGIEKWMLTVIVAIKIRPKQERTKRGYLKLTQ